MASTETLPEFRFRLKGARSGEQRCPRITFRPLLPPKAMILHNIKIYMRRNGLRKTYRHLPSQKDFQFKRTSQLLMNTTNYPGKQLQLSKYKMCVGFYKSYKVYAYLPATEMQQDGPRGYPLVQVEDDIGDVYVEEDGTVMNDVLSETIKQRAGFELLQPFCSLGNGLRSTDVSDRWYAMLSWYYFLSDRDTRGVKWHDFFRQFSRTMEHLNKNSRI